MLPWPCGLALEIDGLGLAALRLLGLCDLDAGTQGLQPQLEGLLHLEVCLALSLTVSSLSSVDVRPGGVLLVLTPERAFVQSRLAVSFPPRVLLSKASLVRILSVRSGTSATRTHRRFEVFPARPGCCFLVSVQGRVLRSILGKAGLETGGGLWKGTGSPEEIQILEALRIVSWHLCSRARVLSFPGAFPLPFAGRHRRRRWRAFIGESSLRRIGKVVFLDPGS